MLLQTFKSTTFSLNHFYVLESIKRSTMFVFEFFSSYLSEPVQEYETPVKGIWFLQSFFFMSESKKAIGQVDEI